MYFFSPLIQLLRWPEKKRWEPLHSRPVHISIFIVLFAANYESDQQLNCRYFFHAIEVNNMNSSWLLLLCSSSSTIFMESTHRFYFISHLFLCLAMNWNDKLCVCMKNLCNFVFFFFLLRSFFVVHLREWADLHISALLIFVKYEMSGNWLPFWLIAEQFLVRCVFARRNHFRLCHQSHTRMHLSSWPKCKPDIPTL